MSQADTKLCFTPSLGAACWLEPPPILSRGVITTSEVGAVDRCHPVGRGSREGAHGHSRVFKKTTPKSHFISSAHILPAGLSLITALGNEGAGWL